MASLNKVMLMGNLTRDPELRYTSGGTAICQLGLAVNRRYQTRQGEDAEEVCFVDIDVFGRQAESVKNYLQKGSPALIEGRLHFDQWEDRTTGQKRSRLKVTAEHVQFLGGPGRGGRAGDGDTPSDSRHDQEHDERSPQDGGRPPQNEAPPSPQPPVDASPDANDDIPF